MIYLGSNKIPAVVGRRYRFQHHKEMQEFIIQDKQSYKYIEGPQKGKSFEFGNTSSSWEDYVMEEISFKTYYGILRQK